MLNMNCRGYWQRSLPLPDLTRKIEGDSNCRVSFSRLNSQNTYLSERRYFPEITAVGALFAVKLSFW